MFWSRAIIYLIRLIFIINALYLAVTLKFVLAALLLGSLVLVLVPEIFTKITGVKIPKGARACYAVFILGTQWLGTYLRLYDSLLWWDIMLHFLSGILLGYVGLVLMVWLDKEHSIKGENKPIITILFSFCVAVSGAVFWEIIEFLADTFLGSHTQLGSLQDTMEDMIYGTLGAALFACYLYRGFRRNKVLLFEKLIALNKKDKEDE
ncbi:MAG: hypothetical protein K0S30_449 [Clostridia bacterium]|jgi:uncharacterized membrane protein YjdF|nr:hypothetical protein [Clostridia bacterium]